MMRNTEAKRERLGGVRTGGQGTDERGGCIEREGGEGRTEGEREGGKEKDRKTER